MKIAVIGAGLAGLAAAWHALTSIPKARVTIFDEQGLGAGASRIAGGLLHSYAGAEARRSWEADSALQAAKELLDIASIALGKAVYRECGILRVAVTDEQRRAFQQTASLYEDVSWWRAEQCQEACDALLPYPGIFISSGIAVECALYLEGLLQACRNRGAELVIQKIDSAQEIPDYDRVIFACGKGLVSKPSLKVRLTKGQLLILRYAKRIPFPIISEKYLTFGPEPGTIVAGATYERRWATEGVEPAIAQANILPGIAAFAPEIAEAPVIECRAAFRAWVASHRPFVAQIGAKEWAIGGLGSKGLLYHALLGKTILNSLN